MGIQVDYWKMKLGDALHLKFKRGREAHGEAWGGRHPLVEAYEELLDAIVYMTVANGPPGVIKDLHGTAMEMGTFLRDLNGFPDFDAAAFKPEWPNDPT